MPEIPRLNLNRNSPRPPSNPSCLALAQQKSDRRFIYTTGSDNYVIGRSPNSFLIIIALSKLLNIDTSKALNAQGSFIQRVKRQPKDDFLIRNIPAIGQKIYHREQMDKVLTKHTQSETDWVKTINQYPSVEFVLACLVREHALQYFIGSNTIDHDLLIGNQYEVIQDYELQPRSSALQIIVNSLDVCIEIITHSQGTSFFECIGNSKNSTKVKIVAEETGYFFYFVEPLHQRLTQSINQVTFKNRLKQSQELNDGRESVPATARSQHKRLKRNSTSKDKCLNKCKICQKNSHFCQCKNVRKSLFVDFRMPELVKASLKLNQDLPKPERRIYTEHCFRISIDLKEKENQLKGKENKV